MSERRVLALTTWLALTFAHCAWSVPGVGVAIDLASDDAPGPVVDARGEAHEIVRAELRVESFELLPCPGEELALLGPASARAHDGEGAASGPVILDLLAIDPLSLGRVELVPGRYCDARLRIAPGDDGAPALSIVTRTIAIESDHAREVVVRLPMLALSGAARDAHVVIRASLARALERVDPLTLDPEVDGARALGAVLSSLRAD